MPRSHEVDGVFGTHTRPGPPHPPGTSLASDHQGRLLGYKSDYFVGADHTMIVNVPTRGTGTLYARLGDGVGWLCVLGLLALPLVALTRRRRPPARRARSSLHS